MGLDKFIKITNTPKSAAPAKSPAMQPTFKRPSSGSNFSTMQIAGVGLILLGFILIGIAMVTW